MQFVGSRCNLSSSLRLVSLFILLLHFTQIWSRETLEVHSTQFAFVSSHVMTGSYSMTRAQPKPEIRPMCGNNASRLRPMGVQRAMEVQRAAEDADDAEAAVAQWAVEAPLAWSQAARVADTQWAVIMEFEAKKSEVRQAVLVEEVVLKLGVRAAQAEKQEIEAESAAATVEMRFRQRLETQTECEIDTHALQASKRHLEVEPAEVGFTTIGCSGISVEPAEAQSTAEIPESVKASRTADSRSAQRPAQRLGARSARRPADARRSAARPAQRLGASARRPAEPATGCARWPAACARRLAESVELGRAVQLTWSCCSGCADGAQRIGRRNPPYAGRESQSQLRRSSRPGRTAASCRSGSGSGKLALSSDNALQQIAEALPAQRCIDEVVEALAVRLRRSQQAAGASEAQHHGVCRGCRGLDDREIADYQWAAEAQLATEDVAGDRWIEES